MIAVKLWVKQILLNLVGTTQNYTTINDTMFNIGCKINKFLGFHRDSFPHATILPKMHLLEDHLVPFWGRVWSWVRLPCLRVSTPGLTIFSVVSTWPTEFKAGEHNDRALPTGIPTKPTEKKVLWQRWGSHLTSVDTCIYTWVYKIISYMICISRDLSNLTLLVWDSSFLNKSHTHSRPPNSHSFLRPELFYSFPPIFAHAQSRVSPYRVLNYPCFQSPQMYRTKYNSTVVGTIFWDWGIS